MFLVKYLILFYDYAFILGPLPLSMYRHISLSKLHTPYVDMKYEIEPLGLSLETSISRKPTISEITEV